jgi:hypothetical protein
VAVVRSRVVLVGGGFVVAVALLAASAWWFGVRHEGGPLHGAAGAAASACISAQGSTEFSYAFGGLHNVAGKDAKITGIALIGSEGLLLADAVVTTAEQPAPVIVREWPPPGSQLVWGARTSAVGTRMPPSDGPDGKPWQLVLRLRTADDRALARLAGVRVDYSVGTRRYRAESDQRLAVVRSGVCTDGDTAEPGSAGDQRITGGGGS